LQRRAARRGVQRVGAQAVGQEVRLGQRRMSSQPRRLMEVFQSSPNHRLERGCRRKLFFSRHSVESSPPLTNHLPAERF
jgi:hypothetical protein